MSFCQREQASCGACCGAYNRTDVARGAVSAELRRRTRSLAGTPRTRGAFRAAARALSESGPAPFFPSVRVCPLLGFLDADERRVGCLAHPAATGGPDLRDCGAYEAGVCEGFSCPSLSCLSEDEVVIAEEATRDWHLYGLVVTDAPFLRAALGAVAETTGARVERRHLDHPQFRAALRRLLELKTGLAPGSQGLYGAFEVAARPPRHLDPGARPCRDPLEPPGIARPARGRDASPYDAILGCVGADPRSGNDLDRLGIEVRRRLDACVASFPPSP